ncbi:MAG: hypothetical protein JF595_05840 [Sphingomonadales bacterium]|nr:hypothetical protein [Sphingomonadales bacterium]
MRLRILILTAALALTGCGKHPATKSLVGDFAAPGVYAIAGDTITVWKRVRQPDGAWRFHSYSITPGGTVEYLETPETADTPGDLEETPADLAERRKSFALPQSEFEAIRGRVALLRPASLGPTDPVGGYGGETTPAGCTLDRAQRRIAGVNFLNRVNWGGFVLQSGCTARNAAQATAVVAELFDRLDRAAAH